MTPAEHAALSAQLARAIGWVDVIVGLAQDPDGCFVAIPNYGWWPFDYRDPTVAMGVLEWLMREHGVIVFCSEARRIFIAQAPLHSEVGDTLPEAIARAAIAV